MKYDMLLKDQKWDKFAF